MKRGPPFGHKGTSRKRPDRVDTTIVLEFEECPYCGGELKELEDVRVRYEEEIIPVPLYVIKYIVKQGYCKHCDKVVYPEIPETEKVLKNSEDRERMYADFVERLEKFVTLKGKWNHHAVKKLAKQALKYRDELFTFVLVPGVDPR